MTSRSFLWTVAVTTLMLLVKGSKAQYGGDVDIRVTQVESKHSKMEGVIEGLEQATDRLRSYLEELDIVQSEKVGIKLAKRHVPDEEEHFSSMESRLLALSETQAVTITKLTSMLNDHHHPATGTAERQVSPCSCGNNSEDIHLISHKTDAIQNSISDLKRTLLSNISDLHESTVDTIREFHLQQLTRNLSSVNATSTVYDDCHAAWESGIRSPAVYTLKPPGYKSFDAWCAFDHLHGWTVIQRRYNGSVNFYLPWDNYKNGFGDLNGEYWLGNDNIHALTRTNRKLSIYLMKWNGEEATANYSSFYIDNESNNYKLTISGYSGNAGEDRMSYHNGQSFSTRDKDNDSHDSRNCASYYTGAWWYDACHNSNLNAVWTSSSTSDNKHIYWGGSWSGVAIHRTAIRITRD